jgi:hypothetical protein
MASKYRNDVTDDRNPGKWFKVPVFALIVKAYLFPVATAKVPGISIFMFLGTKTV